MIRDLLVSFEEAGGMDLKKNLKLFEVESANVVLGLTSRMREREMNETNAV
jgi:hypothetical protein